MSPPNIFGSIGRHADTINMGDLPAQLETLNAQYAGHISILREQAALRMEVISELQEWTLTRAALESEYANKLSKLNNTLITKLEERCKQHILSSTTVAAYKCLLANSEEVARVHASTASSLQNDIHGLLSDLLLESQCNIHDCEEFSNNLNSLCKNTMDNLRTKAVSYYQFLTQANNAKSELVKSERKEKQRSSVFGLKKSKTKLSEMYNLSNKRVESARNHLLIGISEINAQKEFYFSHSLEKLVIHYDHRHHSLISKLISKVAQIEKVASNSLNVSSNALKEVSLTVDAEEERSALRSGDRMHFFTNSTVFMFAPSHGDVTNHLQCSCVESEKDLRTILEKAEIDRDNILFDLKDEQRRQASSRYPFSKTAAIKELELCRLEACLDLIEGYGIQVRRTMPPMAPSSRPPVSLGEKKDITASTSFNVDEKIISTRNSDNDSLKTEPSDTSQQVVRRRAPAPPRQVSDLPPEPSSNSESSPSQIVTQDGLSSNAIEDKFNNSTIDDTNVLDSEKNKEKPRKSSDILQKVGFKPAPAPRRPPRSSAVNARMEAEKGIVNQESTPGIYDEDVKGKLGDGALESKRDEKNESSDSSLSGSSSIVSLISCDIKPMDDERIRNIITKTAHLVHSKGHDFIDILLKKHSSNPAFGFLTSEHEDNKYFLSVLSMLDDKSDT